MPGGVVAAIRRERQALVLCYHAVSERWAASLSATPESLERQVSSLLDAGYVATTFRAAVLEPPAPRTLAVTFDDAYRSVAEVAEPVLRALNVPATVFAPTAFIGGEAPMSWPGIAHWAEGRDASELAPMSWDQLGQLAERGWEIGSHTRTHPRLPDLDREAALEELEGSRLDCEAKLGIRCRSVAYPYGDYSGETLEVARQAGYAAAGVLARHAQRPIPLAWPRVGIYHGDGELRFRLKVSPAMRRLRTSRAWHARRWLARTRATAPAGS
jgi:peptidoglycan/xylan/chitin deacetylase (PgdA/CDA1 family)